MTDPAPDEPIPSELPPIRDILTEWFEKISLPVVLYE